MTRSLAVSCWLVSCCWLALGAGCGGLEAPLDDELAAGKGDWSYAQSRVCPPGGPDTDLGAMPVQGFDVSSHQPAIDWSEVGQAGKVFALARVSNGYQRDRSFVSHFEGLARAGIVRGAYHFLQPGQDAATQAGVFLEALEEAGGLGPNDLPPVLDIETYDEPAAVVRQRMQTWIDIVGEATQTLPIVYTMGGMSNLVGTGFSHHYLWVANFYQTCPRTPEGWPTWDFHQYTDRGRIDGIPGSVDLDVFNGSLADFEQLVANRGFRR